MSLEAWYDPADLAREERAFRNLCGYLADHDSGTGGMLENMSILQLALFAWEAEAMLCAPSELTSSAYATMSLLATLITSFSGCVSCPYDHWSTNFLCVDVVFGPFSGEVDDGIPRKL